VFFFLHQQFRNRLSICFDCQLQLGRLDFTVGQVLTGVRQGPLALLDISFGLQQLLAEHLYALFTLRGRDLSCGGRRLQGRVLLLATSELYLAGFYCKVQVR
jgi:hypothetical protein